MYSGADELRRKIEEKPILKIGGAFDAMSAKLIEINEFDVEGLSLKLRVHQYLQENDIVIECCKKILKIDSDNFEVRDILNALEEN